MAKKNQMPPPPGADFMENGPRDPVVDLDGQPEGDVSPPIPPPRSKKKIKVTANHCGFIHQHRKVPGDKFEVYEHELGHWMDCDDPIEDKKHKAKIEARRKGINARAIAEDEKDRKSSEADE